MFAIASPRFRNNGLDVLSRELDALFGAACAAPSVATLPASLWKEEGGDLVVELDVPGVLESDLDVEYHKGRLTVRGERNAPEGAQFAHNSRKFGKFAQVVALPDDYHGEPAGVEFEAGVLRLRFRPRPEAQPRKIAIGGNKVVAPAQGE